ncbi:hypothetical protein MRX96_040478 [Rhipicephalus microplus]
MQEGPPFLVRRTLLSVLYFLFAVSINPGLCSVIGVRRCRGCRVVFVSTQARKRTPDFRLARLLRVPKSIRCDDGRARVSGDEHLRVPPDEAIERALNSLGRRFVDGWCRFAGHVIRWNAEKAFAPFETSANCA